MSNKLLYDPKRLIKLQKNEILNEFRTRFSQEFYKTFKEAEKQIWNDQDQNFQFLEQIVISLQNELDEIQNALAQKVQAWSSVAEAEKKNSQNHKIEIPKPKQVQNNFANIQNNVSAPTNTEFEDFDFFDEA